MGKSRRGGVVTKSIIAYIEAEKVSNKFCNVKFNICLQIMNGMYVEKGSRQLRRHTVFTVVGKKMAKLICKKFNYN